ncbi:hypothetical protein JIN84_12290 [Luteolibacter yonseiensis]|uniref:Uncharacterized protein n=1 Tax=Luteolibacter yonseiensis TaxID=1144680 RepID=A0A934V7Q4_9BACT|nr:hypothetical protein [Luteolibacter yonseiensis]MBK1816397.1 hypothetical protein [Luteolibacter yonseiensis]
MMEILTFLLRLAGAGLVLLAVSHIPIGRHLKWTEDARGMSPVNRSIFHVHTIFICVVLVMMGLPCLLEPRIFLEPSRAGSWLAWSISAFWGLRLYFQWFVYRADLWRGKRLETAMHWWFTFVWIGLAALFALCGMWQAWISG